MSGAVLAELDAIPAPGAGGLQVQVGDVPVGLFRVGDEVVAWRSVCPHAAAPVCVGEVDGTRLPSAVYEYEYGRDREILQCPWHGWEFDLRSGDHLAEGSAARLRRHPIRVEDGRVYDASRGAAIDLLLAIETVRRETDRILVVDLVAPDGSQLPAWAPGSHLELVLPSGLVRHYSLCGDPRDRSRYRIAVLLEAPGRGGSEELHRAAEVGLVLRVTAIRNRFPLPLAPSYLLVAGGIGITALLPMIAMLRRKRATFRLVYLGRERSSMAFLDELREIPEARIVESRIEGRVDVRELVRDAAPGSAILACGPDSLLDELRAAVADAPQPLDLRTEAFQPLRVGRAAPPDRPDRDVSVVLAASGRTVEVRAGTSILSAVRASGIAAPSSCEAGWCGTCETSVLEGVPEHRDAVLGDVERAAGDTMMICVSRAESERLVLDL
jgi:ferredoxin-NADP reductase/nitrite reductase/ring-hydroxylating ferredoxin subunit